MIRPLTLRTSRHWERLDAVGATIRREGDRRVRDFGVTFHTWDERRLLPEYVRRQADDGGEERAELQAEEAPDGPTLLGEVWIEVYGPEWVNRINEAFRDALHGGQVEREVVETYEYGRSLMAAHEQFGSPRAMPDRARELWCEYSQRPEHSRPTWDDACPSCEFLHPAFHKWEGWGADRHEVVTYVVDECLNCGEDLGHPAPEPAVRNVPAPRSETELTVPKREEPVPAQLTAEEQYVEMAMRLQAATTESSRQGGRRAPSRGSGGVRIRYEG